MYYAYKEAGGQGVKQISYWNGFAEHFVALVNTEEILL